MLAKTLPLSALRICERSFSHRAFVTRGIAIRDTSHSAAQTHWSASCTRFASHWCGSAAVRQALIRLEGAHAFSVSIFDGVERLRRLNAVGPSLRLCPSD